MNNISAEIRTLLDSVVSGLINLIPNLILGAIVLIVGFILAKLSQRLIKNFVLYLNRNINQSLGDRLITVDLKNSAQLIGRMLFWIILIFTFALITQILGLPLVPSWFNDLIHFVPNILAAMVIIFIGFMVGKLVKDIISSTAQKTGFAQVRNVGKLLQYVIQFISIVIALDQIGMEILFLTNLVTIVLAILMFGAALAFGLGSKNSVSNILGTYYFQKLYQVGNTIEVGDIKGVIIRITGTTVVLQTQSGEVSVPGKNFSSEKITLYKEGLS